MPNIAVELGKLSTRLGVNAVYGEKQDIDGVTMVPVAASWSGFGGGSDDSEQGGGGGGAVSVPVGAYVRRPEGLRFEPNIIALLTVAVPFVCVTGNALRKIIRALKK